ncbi:MAG: arginine--tRNA ligase [Thermoplasmata archaeon]|nr:arginine--tRNA ligase [Thermoplasmata archaeon]
MLGADASAAGGLWDPWLSIRQHIVRELALRLGAHGYPESADALERQLDDAPSGVADFGYATHRAAKSVGTPPERLATELAADFPLGGGLARVTSEGAYVNFHADTPRLIESTLELVFARGPEYGRGPPRTEKVCVEHTSANPTGPFHVGRVRNGVIGDTMARILRAAGYPVTTEYYVDDMGRQSAMITWIWSMPVDQWPPEVREGARPPEGVSAATEKADHWYGRPYRSVSELLKKDPLAAQQVGELVRQVESGNSPARHREIGEAVLKGMLASLARIGIRFDEFVWESTLVQDGSVGRVIERLRKAPHATVEENGALALDARGYGLPKENATIVVTRGDGTSLYPTRDVAYHLQKFSRFARVIDVLGQDHQLHARTLVAMLTEVGEARRPEFLIYQDITVPEGGRMSTRKGKAVNLDDLLDEAVERAHAEVLKRREDLSEDQVTEIAQHVGAGAVRFHVLRIAPDKPVKFRWEEALSFEGRSGPFLQYSYARAASILRKASREAPPYPFEATALTTHEETELVRAIGRLPGTVAYVSRTSHVHTVATYAFGLAEAFNRFYQSVPVLRAEEPAKSSRLALVAATRQTLGNTLDLLGVERLERM